MTPIIGGGLEEFEADAEHLLDLPDPLCRREDDDPVLGGDLTSRRRARCTLPSR